MFATVAAEKMRDDYHDYYGRLWLVSVDRQNDLVLEANLLPHKNSLHKLDGIQNYVAQVTGLTRRPVIDTVIRVEAETAANPTLLRPLQMKVMPVWRQAVNLAAAGLWVWLVLWLVRKAVARRTEEMPRLSQGFMVLLVLRLLVVAVSEVRAVFHMWSN